MIATQGFGLAEALDPFQSSWHTQQRHQLVYVVAGSLHLRVQGALWLVPPQRAAWISAGVMHQMYARRPVILRTIYLAPHLAASAPLSPCAVFQLPPLGREMVEYAVRFGPSLAGPAILVAERFFSAMGVLVGDWMESAQPLHLPDGRSQELKDAMSYALSHLGDCPGPAIEEAAGQAGISVRTLARRFQDEAKTTWRVFLHSARMLRAMELLGEPGARVTEVALQVGFESLGAFSRAFAEFAGEKPKDYRRRLSCDPTLVALAARLQKA